MRKLNRDRLRDQRRRDFEIRAAAEPEGPLLLAAGGKGITIHPLADEHELLARLGIRPEQCWSVDCYWSVGEDVVFLQLSTRAEGLREPGLYARRASYPPRYVNLVVVEDVPFITREVLESAARDLLHVGWDDVQLGEKLRRIGPRSA